MWRLAPLWGGTSLDNRAQLGMTVKISLMLVADNQAFMRPNPY